LRVERGAAARHAFGSLKELRNVEHSVFEQVAEAAL
jgi:hypothetical protein